MVLDGPRGSLASLRCRSTGLPAEHRGDGRAAEAERLEGLARLHAVVEIAPVADDRERPEGVADPDHRLPGELRVAGAEVDVVRDEPFAARGECEASLRADDRIPVVD